MPRGRHRSEPEIGLQHGEVGGGHRGPDCKVGGNLTRPLIKIDSVSLNYRDLSLVLGN